MATSKRDVLIVGAGPAGLTLALAILKQGISPSSIRIVDRSQAVVSTSRALAIQARTLELYRSLNITDELLCRGHKVPAVNLWARRAHRARIPFANIGETWTPYPFLFVLPQDRLEPVLEKALNENGVFVEREVELISFEERTSCISARLSTPQNGKEHETNDETNDEANIEICDTTYLIGCDGAHSAVRRGMNVQFQGAAYEQLFYVADIETDDQSPIINGEVHLTLNKEDFILVIPYDQNRSARLVGVLSTNGDSNEEQKYNFDNDVKPHVKDALDLNMVKVNWFSTYRVHHRVVDQFRVGRVFLVGDAAHIHSPVGGQGMNTGVGDAFNLSWKLAAALKGQISDSTGINRLFASYEVERRAFALQLVNTTDRAFTFITAKGFIADIIRQWVVPVIMPLALSFYRLRDFAFRAVSQTLISYRQSPLTDGRGATGTDPIRSGDRLPWVKIWDGDNFFTFNVFNWQIHVYGTATARLQEWCQQKDTELHVFDWQEQYIAAGLRRDAVYLLRPDQYIAAIVPPETGDVTETLNQYLLSKGLNFSPGV